jgi:hypothetical protein
LELLDTLGLTLKQADKRDGPQGKTNAAIAFQGNGFHAETGDPSTPAHYSISISNRNYQ